MLRRIHPQLQRKLMPVTRTFCRFFLKFCWKYCIWGAANVKCRILHIKIRCESQIELKIKICKVSQLQLVEYCTLVLTCLGVSKYNMYLNIKLDRCEVINSTDGVLEETSSTIRDKLWDSSTRGPLAELFTIIHDKC